MAKILEIAFKGERKAFFSNPQEFPFVVGDFVVVQAEKGEDLGQVVNMGSLVDKRAGDQEFLQILRKPSRADLERRDENQQLEREAFEDCRKRIEEHGLEMKLVDVEYQFDRNKITFYFRDEAKRIGGVGVCGRRLCCTTFLREFEPIVTQFAKDQNLALNPTKLSGCCGRLMCCLRYELDYYTKVLKKFPERGQEVKTAKGTGVLTKVDVFKEEAIIEYVNEGEETISLQELKSILEGEKDKKRKKKKSKKKKRTGDLSVEEVQTNSGD